MAPTAIPVPTPAADTDIDQSLYVWDTPTPAPTGPTPAGTITRVPGFALLLALAAVLIAAFVMHKKR